MPAPEAVAVVVAVFCAAVVNGVSGFGFMLVLVPPLSLLLGPVDGVIVANLVSIFQGITMFLLLRKEVIWRTLALLLLAGAAGMPVGMVALLGLPADAIRVTIAVSVLAGTVAIWRGWQLRSQGALAQGGVGFLSGALKTSAGINGPPVVLYLQGAGLEPLAFRATLSAFFLASNLLAVATIAASGELTERRALSAILAAPFLVVGALTGNRLFSHLSPVIFRRLVLALLVAGSAAVLIAAVVS